jgi:hypothetical protein
MNIEDENTWQIKPANYWDCGKIWIDSKGRIRKKTWGSGSMSYYDEDGRWHRLDGPARQYGDVKEWFYHGIEIKCQSQEEFEQYLKMKAFW